MESFFTAIFKACVEFLLWLGGLFGLSYYAVNVILFCFIMPLVFILMLWEILRLRKQIRMYKHRERYPK